MVKGDILLPYNHSNVSSFNFQYKTMLFEPHSFSELSDTSLILWSSWMLGLLVLMLIKLTGSSWQYLWWKFCWSFIRLDLKNFLWDFGMRKCINLNTHYYCINLIDCLSYPRILIWCNPNINTTNKCGHTNVALFYLYCSRILEKKMVLI